MKKPVSEGIERRWTMNLRKLFTFISMACIMLAVTGYLTTLYYMPPVYASSDHQSCPTPVKTEPPAPTEPPRVTDVPPTSIPPTSVPPTAVQPPTNEPPTEAPPTDIPLTEAPPTDVPTEPGVTSTKPADPTPTSWVTSTEPGEKKPKSTPTDAVLPKTGAGEDGKLLLYFGVGLILIILFSATRLFRIYTHER